MIGHEDAQHCRESPARLHELGRLLLNDKQASRERVNHFAGLSVEDMDLLAEFIRRVDLDFDVQAFGASQVGEYLQDRAIGALVAFLQSVQHDARIAAVRPWPLLLSPTDESSSIISTQDFIRKHITLVYLHREESMNDLHQLVEILDQQFRAVDHLLSQLRHRLQLLLDVVLQRGVAFVNVRAYVLAPMFGPRLDHDAVNRLGLLVHASERSLLALELAYEAQQILGAASYLGQQLDESLIVVALANVAAYLLKAAALRLVSSDNTHLLQ